MIIQEEITIQSDIEAVWSAWTTTNGITSWFAPAAEIEPKVGGKFELYFNPENTDTMCTKGCRIVQLDEPHLLVFEWKGPDPFAGVMNHPGELTTVKVTMKTVDKGTHVYLEHLGWKDSNEWNTARGWHVDAWKQMLDSLKSNLESGAGSGCCN